jgi:mannose-1-phosphate guanylyltransferase
VIRADHLGIDTENCVVSGTKDGRLIATLGVKDLVIVDTPDALLVCDRSRAQDVKKLVEELKNRGRRDLV